MANDLSQAKDYIYVICTVIQTVLACVGLGFVSFWWDWRKRKVDQKKASQKADEDRQKADAEKIAAILSKKYDEVEQIFFKFKKIVDKLKRISIGTYTAFHILQYYMLREYLFVFKENMPGIEKISSDIDKIMKLFTEFRYQFSTIESKTCPEVIKEEFSTEIIDMGHTISPFVSRSRQQVIEKVLKYFKTPDDSVQIVQEERASFRSSRCFFACRCCRRREDNNMDMHSILGPPNANQEPNQPEQSIPFYPCHSLLENAIPYIGFFRFENGQMHFDLRCDYKCVEILEVSVVTKLVPGVLRKEKVIRDEIVKIWPHKRQEMPDGDLLHLIRMVMFRLSIDPHFFQQQLLDNFIKYVKSVVYSKDNLVAGDLGNEDLEKAIRQCKGELARARADELTKYELLSSLIVNSFKEDY